MKPLLTTILSFLLLTSPLFGQSERPETIIIPVSSMGDVSDIRKQILQNTLTDELKTYFRIVPQEKYEEALEQVFQELEFEECTEDTCIMRVQEMLQVENVFNLQVIGEGKDSQLNLKWITLDEKRNEEDYCEGCGTGQLRKMIVGLVEKLVDFTEVSTIKAADSSAPIVIPTHNWSSQIVMAYVVGGIFESLGDNVKYLPADSQAVYESIRKGDVTISHVVWHPFYKSFNNAIKKGGIIDAGTHAAVIREEVGVPQWVIDKNLCPGLPNWEALKSCKNVFTSPDSGGKGRILDGPRSWHGPEYPDRVQALLGDDWVVNFAGSANALWAELASAKREGRGTIIFNWTPNFTDREGFVFIEWPPYYTGCRKQDGGDSKCGSPKLSLKKAANDKFPITHPKAYMAFSRMSFNTKGIGQMAALVDIDKMSHENAARKWLADHKDVWKPFTQD